MNRHAAAWIGLLALVLAAASGSAVFVGLKGLTTTATMPVSAPCHRADEGEDDPTWVVVVVPNQSLPDSLGARPTPTLTPTLDVRLVSGTAGLPLLVRAAPGGAVVGALPEGDLVVVTGRPRLDATGAAWYRVTQHGDQAVTGWVLGMYLATAEPEGFP